MRIISQSRDLSIDFDKCIIKVFGTEILWEYGNRDRLLGRYGSYKRAAEVFEDIHRAYAPVYSISGNFSEEEIREMLVKSQNIVANNVIGVSDSQFVTTYSDYLYYMPEK